MENKVLIVDDDEHIRLAIRELFESEGIAAVGAENALECEETIRKGFRGVVLMDIMMPVEDGWDAIRRIIENGLYKDMIIVMLTAKDIPDRKMEGLQEYVTDYITKPFEPDELVAAVKEYFTYIDAGRR